MLLAPLLSVVVGCAINHGDICTVDYMNASRKDTAPTQAEILAHNELLKKQGCPEKKSADSGPAGPGTGALDGLLSGLGKLPHF